MASSSEVLVTIAELKRFMVECSKKEGINEDHANQLANILVAADYRGHYSHGLNRLGMYLRESRAGMCSADGQPEILAEKASTCWVDGKNLLGVVVGNFCMDLAIAKAKSTGIGWVVAKRSNHYGIAGWYALKACEQGLIGLSFTNGSPIVFPTRGSKTFISSNPISMGAPAEHGDNFCLDMATSTVALGKVEIAQVKGQPLPRGWGADFKGKETLNPEDVLSKDGGLLPLGGVEESGGYKGYGLALMVEVLCAVLGGANWGPNIRDWKGTVHEEANLGQCFVAVDPNSFAPDFSGRMQTVLDTFRRLEPAEGETEVLVAGDPEKKHMNLCNDLGGIPYDRKLIEVAQNLAKEMNVEPLNVKHY